MQNLKCKPKDFKSQKGKNKMRNKTLIFAILTVFFLLLAPYVHSEVPHLVRFQGKITDTQGAPLNGNYNITFRIYDAESGGALLWSETQSAVPVNNGIFTALLGNVAALDLPFDAPYWLSMEVNNDGEMAPRQRISSVGYAIHAETAESFIDESVVPQGAIILWRGDSCPVGYSRVTEMDGKFLVSDATYNAAAGGSNTHTHGAGSYCGPSHNHAMQATGPSYGNVNTNPTNHDTEVRIFNNRLYGRGGAESAPHLSTTVTNSGTGPITGTSAPADSRPEFATVILCEKD